MSLENSAAPSLPGPHSEPTDASGGWDSLPPEIIMEIFEAAVNSEAGRDTRVLTSLRLLSRRMRAICDGCAGVWSEFHIRSLPSQLTDAHTALRHSVAKHADTLVLHLSNTAQVESGVLTILPFEDFPAETKEKIQKIRIVLSAEFRDLLSLQATTSLLADCGNVTEVELDTHDLKAAFMNEETSPALSILHSCLDGFPRLKTFIKSRVNTDRGAELMPVKEYTPKQSLTYRAIYETIPFLASVGNEIWYHHTALQDGRISFLDITVDVSDVGYQTGMGALLMKTALHYEPEIRPRMRVRVLPSWYGQEEWMKGN